MPERIMVPFDGDTSGEAPLTWGQQHIWDWICRSGEALSMSAVRTLDDGAKVDEFVAELRFFMNRFEAMRTRLRPDEAGLPRQVVDRSGEVALEIVDVDRDEDPAAVADAVLARQEASHFDYAHEWPIRMALVRRAGSLTHQVTTLCHVVVDSSAAMAMFTDLIARDPATGELAEPVPMGPLELASWQQSPAGLRQSNAAMVFWRKQLRIVPAALAPAPTTTVAWPGGTVGTIEPDPPRYWQVEYDSPAMYLALRCLTDRLGCDTSPVLLTSYATALARVVGYEPVAFAVFANNRFRPGLATMVSPVNQAALCVLELTGKTFDETVSYARRRTLNAYKNAYYDHVQRDALIAEVSRERGVPLDLECWVNDRRTVTDVDSAAPLPTGTEVRSALSRSTLRRAPMAMFFKKLMLTINDADDVVSLSLQADVEYISLADLERLAHEIEAVAVEAVPT